MTDLITCNKHLEEMIDECHDLTSIENPTHKDIEQCVRDWWVGIR
jgi:hypothetical protein